MLSQIDLVSAICKHLEKQGVETANTRQMNAVISAATKIVEEFEKPQTGGMCGSPLGAGRTEGPAEMKRETRNLEG